MLTKASIAKHIRVKNPLAILVNLQAINQITQRAKRSKRPSDWTKLAVQVHRLIESLSGPLPFSEQEAAKFVADGIERGYSGVPKAG